MDPAALRRHTDRDILAALVGFQQSDRYWARRPATAPADQACKARGEANKAALLAEARRRGLEIGESVRPALRAPGA